MGNNSQGLQRVSQFIFSRLSSAFSAGRFSLKLLPILLVSLLLASCGGGGGGSSSDGSDDSSDNPNTNTPSPVESPRTLELGAPSPNPVVLPPSGELVPITFISVVSGTAYPDAITLDEVDSEGRLLTSDVAQLRDDGEGADVYRGDRVYAATVMAGSVNSVEQFFRVRADNEGEEVTSGMGAFWVSGCPVRARPSNPQAVVADDRTGANIFANEVMITVEENVAPALENINRIAGGVDGRVVGCIPSLSQYLLEIEGDGSAQGVYDAIDLLLADVDVANASPNVQVSDLPQGQPVVCNGRECQWYLDRIRAPLAWTIGGAGDEQQGVAVIDFGIDCTHPELECDGSIYNQDFIDHGTGVASLISASNQDNTDFAGVAWNTNLYPYSFLGNGGSQYKMSELITLSLSEDNVKVINVSATSVLDPNDQILNAICGAIDSGRLVVAAAGNAEMGSQCELSSSFPARYNTLGQCPNGVDLQSGLLVVGATDIDNNLAEWNSGSDNRCSNTLHVDMFAPGKDIYTASATGDYATKNGTSYAAPLVAGGAAVLWSANPEMTASEIHNQLISESTTLDSQSGNALAQTSDQRVEGRPLLNLYRALGGNDTVDVPDNVPDPVSFVGQSDVSLNTFIISEPVTISGIDTVTTIDVIGGFYSIDSAPFTNAAGAIAAGQSLRLQVRSAAAPSAQREAEVILGGERALFQVTTEAADTRPDNFDFYDQQGIELSTQVTSNALTIPGINVATPISIIGGEYAIDGGAFTAATGTVDENQTIRLRVTSADTPETTTTATITIGGVSDTYSVTTEAVDVRPNPFALGVEASVPLTTEQLSAVVTVVDINTEAVVSISGGEYAIDGGSFTNDASVINAGQSVQVRHTSASAPDTTTYTALTIGEYTGTYRSTTLAADVSPDSFSFTDQTNIALNTLVTSNAITVTGINTAVPVSISGTGEYRIDGGAFTSVSGTVNNGQTVELRLSASAVPATTVGTTLTVGGVSDTFSVSTVGANLPNAFNFTDQNDVLPNTAVESNVVAISGLNAAATITVTEGEYRLDGGTYTAAAGTINNGQTVQLRQTSSSSFAATTATTLTIAGVSESFNVTTLVADTTPPVITLNGVNPLILTQGDTYTEPGATATDNRDGSVAVTTSGGVDTNAAGTYIITYSASDSAGNIATATRTINVVLPPDTTPPVITLSGANPLTLTQGDTYNEPGVSATDAGDGSVTVTISGTVDTSTVGTYTRTYSAADAAGNTATATRTVNVILAPDTTPPVITLIGANPVTHVQGDSYIDAGATALDDRDGSVLVDSDGIVDVDTVGTYIRTYTATDAAGNTATVTRTVDVISSQRPFVTVWQTDNPGFSNDNQVKIGTEGSGYNYTIDWGDGNIDRGVTGDIIHTYAAPGTYTVSISGSFPHMITAVERFAGSLLSADYDPSKLISVEQWGDIAWGSMSRMFVNTPSDVLASVSDTPQLSQVVDMSYLFYRKDTIPDVTNWNVSNVTNMRYMFGNSTGTSGDFNQDISTWDVSNVTDMSYMFKNRRDFNQPIGGWDVSRVTTMREMFSGNSNFNQPLNNWNVSSVTSMRAMFQAASDFNQDIASWDVSSVIGFRGMRAMFARAAAFNQNIDSWDVSSVADMGFMFSDATSFNQNLSSWVVSSVIEMDSMFSGATSFNGDITTWDVSSVQTMRSMFRGNSTFNQPIGSWDVSNVDNFNFMFQGATTFNQDISNWEFGDFLGSASMDGMFSGATSFNQNISAWDVRGFSSMRRMFENATAFNQNIGGWELNSILDLSYMFSGAISFNQDIGGWNTRFVMDMSYMFNNATAFNQDLSSWRVFNVEDMTDMFTGSSLSTANYSALLLNWGSLSSLEEGVTLGAGTIPYNSSGASGRSALISTYGWIINDGGLQ